MDIRARTRPTLLRAGLLAALTALLVPAVAGTATADAAKRKKKRTPVVTKITPMTVHVGQTLTIHGKHFRRGVNKNTVAFKRRGTKAMFVKAEKGTTKLLKVTLPKRLESLLPMGIGGRVPTRLQIRVLSARFGKRFTALKRSPLVAPEVPPGAPGLEAPAAPAPDADCDRDGQLNGQDADDDNDLLSDTHEFSLKLNGCAADTDSDGVEDGYEYQSALDLNDDRYQGDPSVVQPYPGKTPYPNPLFADANTDFDGDSLSLAQEQSLWVYTYRVNHTSARTLSPLSYSDGMQHSIHRFDNGRNVPNLPVAGYPMRARFIEWATANRYLNVYIPDSIYFDDSYTGWHDIRDTNLQGGVTPSDIPNDDYNGNGFLSDNERDEDADGLSNYQESGGTMQPGFWTACYPMEKPYHVPYQGTKIDDADSDGDGVLDGADDQDHDDLPNLMEWSRVIASDGLDDSQTLKPCKVHEDLELGVDHDGDGQIDLENVNHPDAYGRVNPFNPCLPFRDSRTCPVHPPINDAPAPFDGSPDWLSLH
jgi:hypothetical protein